MASSLQRVLYVENQEQELKVLLILEFHLRFKERSAGTLQRRFFASNKVGRQGKKGINWGRGTARNSAKACWEILREMKPSPREAGILLILPGLFPDTTTLSSELRQYGGMDSGASRVPESLTEEVCPG